MQTYRHTVTLSLTAALALAACGSADESPVAQTSTQGESSSPAPSEDNDSLQCLPYVDPVFSRGPDTVLSDREISDLRDAYFEAYPKFTAISISGSGRQIVDLPDGAWSGILQFTVGESSRSTACTITARGAVSPAVLTATGASRQTVGYGLDGTQYRATHDPQDDIERLLVESDGEWTITLSSVRDLPALTLPISGEGSDIFWLEPDEGTATVKVQETLTTTIVQYLFYAEPWLKIDTSISPRRQFQTTGGGMLTIVDTNGSWQIRQE